MEQLRLLRLKVNGALGSLVRVMVAPAKKIGAGPFEKKEMLCLLLDPSMSQNQAIAAVCELWREAKKSQIKGPHDERSAIFEEALKRCSGSPVSRISAAVRTVKKQRLRFQSGNRLRKDAEQLRKKAAAGIAMAPYLSAFALIERWRKEEPVRQVKSILLEVWSRCRKKIPGESFESFKQSYYVWRRGLPPERKAAN